MAVLASIATGNFTSASTWGVVDSTSYLNAENATESLLTTTYSNTRSASFTPGAITVSHIGVKLCERIGTTGTMSVHMNTSADHVEVAGTEVTINTADLPSALEADLNGGWVFFKLASPVTLSAATGYELEAKTSSATMVDLWCDATADNISRALITTTTQAPAAGDDLIIAGEKTGAGTANAFTVTMNETATTDYGAASTSLVTPGLAICDGGTLTWGTTAATNYNLKLSGNLIIYSGGTMNMGTTGTPCPRDSTQTLTFDCGANVDFGLTVRNGGTWNAQGLSRTSGKNIVSCKLNTDEAAGQTTLGVDTDTGWLNGDEIAIASTTRTASECESRTLNANANASDMTVSSGLTNAHSGTSPTQAEVILLTRNVKVFGASATLQAFVDIKATATVDIDWTEFKWLGSNTAFKRGIDINTTTGSCSIQYSSLHNFEVANSRGFSNSNQTINNVTFSNNTTFLIANSHLYIGNATSGTWTVDANIFIRNTDITPLILLSDVGGSFTNNAVAGSANVGIQIGESGASLGTFSNNTVHSVANSGVYLSVPLGNTTQSTISSLVVWRCSSSGFSFAASSTNLAVTSATFFGNSGANLEFSGTGDHASFLAIDGLVSNGDSTFSTTSGIVFSGSSCVLNRVDLINCDFSTASGIKTAHTSDINNNTATSVDITARNCKFGGTTEVSLQTNMITAQSSIGSQKHDQTGGLHKTWKKYGTITIDTTANMYRTASPSERLTPNNASGKLVSGVKRVAVASGSTLTPSVYVRESVSGDGTDYNGNRPRLILKRNDAIGITSDTTIDTATASAEGAFEQLTGTTASATDDGVMEFYVDCDGTTGWVNVDDWTVS